MQNLNGPRVAVTVSDRAVVKASGERLLRDFRIAAAIVQYCPESLVWLSASNVRSRTQYASILTAFGL